MNNESRMIFICIILRIKECVLGCEMQLVEVELFRVLQLKICIFVVYF